MFDAKKIREDFPILKRKVNGKTLVYFDNAATTQKPVQVINAIRDYYENHNANIHRGVHQLSQEASQMYEDAHHVVGKLIGAKWDETIFTRNTTEGLNLVMYAWAMRKLKKGDEIISTVMEHHSNMVTWQFLKEMGIKLKFVGINDDGTLKMEDYDKLVTRSTKLITVVHASNVVGTINDVRKIGKIAHDNKALFVVDGAQSVPHMPVNVKKMDADFLAFSAHKMLGPTGMGALYGKRSLLQSMDPFMYGGDMIKQVTLEKSTWNDLPWKFEAGTPNICGGVAFAEAVKYLERLKMKNVRKHEEEITKYAMERMSEVDGLKIFGPGDYRNRGGVLSFNLGEIHPHDLATILDEFGVAVRSGQHCAAPLIHLLKAHATTRASFYVYNTKEEVDYFIDVLNKARKVFG
ncbi:cysteine desulfurase [Candidatus Micrarchaeota archaeon RBG_16_49_10]|nr:MAG: cysteine desulfurase [Candidatus Micrarchaeota archaeon RBG_16_49_10]